MQGREWCRRAAERRNRQARTRRKLQPHSAFGNGIQLDDDDRGRSHRHQRHDSEEPDDRLPHGPRLAIDVDREDRLRGEAEEELAAFGVGVPAARVPDLTREVVAGVEELPDGDAADSPITEEGSADQYKVRLGITRSISLDF